jgi:hypothetical protein
MRSWTADLPAKVALVGLLGCSTGSALSSDAVDAAGAPDVGMQLDGATDAAGSRACAVGRSGGDSLSCNICTHATCCLVTGSFDSTCDDCIQAHCCMQLAACDTVGDGGTDYQGGSSCETFFGCVVNYATGAGAGGRDGSSDAAPDIQGGASACAGLADSTARTNARALLTCIQTSCASPCPGI